jgi:hypothetical protein
MVAAAGGATPLIYLDFINGVYRFDGGDPVALASVPGYAFTRGSAETVNDVEYGVNVPIIDAEGILLSVYSTNYDRLRFTLASQISTHTHLAQVVGLPVTGAVTNCFYALTRQVADASDRSQLINDGTNGLLMQIRTAGADQAGVTGGIYTNPSDVTAAMRCAANDARLCDNGNLRTLDETVTLPTQLDEVFLGLNSVDGAETSLRSRMRRYVLWQVGLTDEQLQAAVALAV